MKNSNIFYGWSTTKVENGFRFTVTKNISRETPNENGRYLDSEMVKTGILPTRARAKRMAQKIKMSLK